MSLNETKSIVLRNAEINKISQQQKKENQKPTGENNEIEGASENKLRENENRKRKFRIWGYEQRS